MMMKIVLGVEYFGGDFNGFQRQKNENENLRTVQTNLENAISKIAKQAIKIFPCGRTDAKVHAANQIVHFEVAKQKFQHFPYSAWIKGVNAFLPKNIAIKWCKYILSNDLATEFHARFSAIKRRYRYILLNQNERLGLLAGRCGWYHFDLDVAKMNQAAKFLLGEQDFSCFRAAGCQAKTPIKTMFQANVYEVKNFFNAPKTIFFDLEATGFLLHMVRNIVGTLVYIGDPRKALEITYMKELLKQKNRVFAPPTFSGDGLYFFGASYPTHFEIPELNF